MLFDFKQMNHCCTAASLKPFLSNFSNESQKNAQLDTTATGAAKPVVYFLMPDDLYLSLGEKICRTHR